MTQPRNRTYDQRLGARIRDLRVAQGWSQDDVASMLVGFDLTVNRSQIGKIERGEISVRAEHALAFSRMFAMGVCQLLAPHDNSQHRRTHA